MKKITHLPWIILGVITVCIGVFFLVAQPNLYGGDIIEYYGITESMLNHATPRLTPADETNLKAVLNPAYLQDPLWYIPGVDGHRYPVHFIFYSLLATIIRVVLQVFQLNPLLCLQITNLVLFSGTIAILFRYFVQASFSRLILLIALLFSPLMFFLSWPGPDIFYVCCLLICAFSLYKKQYFLATLSATLASWHSQPLIVLTAGLLLQYVLTQTHISIKGIRSHITLTLPTVLATSVLLLLIALPYLYNYVIFGVASPWSIFQDIRTQYYGFGIQNMHGKKFIEMLFDLNMGLFWYAPVLVTMGVFYFFKTLRKPFEKTTETKTQEHVLIAPALEQQPKTNSWYATIEPKTAWLLLLLIVTAFFYQTNPGWHFGTAGYGPTRHILFLIPFLIYFIVANVQKTRLFGGIVTLYIITQLPILVMNGFLAPNLLNTLSLSPYATYVLNTYPQLYNPTPEIFADRVNHKDEQLPVSAIYKVNGTCKKAYILFSDVALLEKTCGFIPDAYKQALQDPLLRKSTKERTVKTTALTLWPDAYTCDYPLRVKKYLCMFTKEDVMRFAGITDEKRIQKVKNYKGVWQISWGKPITVTIPPGYFINYYSFKGQYVDY